jgi:hypothetical protein
MTRKQQIALFASLFLVAACCLVWIAVRYFFPYGARSCFMPCMLGALNSYALANAGWFPSANGPTNPLTLLYPTHLGSDSSYLAGLSGDRARMHAQLERDGFVHTNSSSWIYVQGFRADDVPRVAILWDTASGVGPVGQRREGRAVGFNDGSMDQIPDARWEAFMAAQADARFQAQSNRIVNSRPP